MQFGLVQVVTGKKLVDLRHKGTKELVLRVRKFYISVLTRL